MTEFPDTNMHHSASINKWPITKQGALLLMWIGSALVQVMARRQLGTKPSSEPMPSYCKSNPEKNEIGIKIQNVSFMKMQMSSAK